MTFIDEYHPLPTENVRVEMAKKIVSLPVQLRKLITWKQDSQMAYPHFIINSKMKHTFSTPDVLGNALAIKIQTANRAGIYRRGPTFQFKVKKNLKQSPRTPKNAADKNLAGRLSQKSSSILFQ